MARRSSAATSAMAAARAALQAPVEGHGHGHSKPTVARAHTGLAAGKIDAAEAAGERLHKMQLRAASARFDRKSRQIVVAFTNGATLGFPPALVQGLSGATPDQLSNVRTVGKGAGLHWEALDVAFSVPGLFNLIFGGRKYNARLAGQVKSPAKAAAARSNGAKGGRPPKEARKGR